MQTLSFAALMFGGAMIVVGFLLIGVGLGLGIIVLALRGLWCLLMWGVPKRKKTTPPHTQQR